MVDTRELEYEQGNISNDYMFRIDTISICDDKTEGLVDLLMSKRIFLLVKGMNLFLKIDFVRIHISIMNIKTCGKMM